MIEACRQNRQTKLQKFCSDLNGVVSKLSALVYRTGNTTALDVYKNLEQNRRSLEKEIRIWGGGTNTQKFQVEKVVEAVRSKILSDAALVEIIRYAPPKSQPKVNDWSDEWRYAASVLRSTGEPKWMDLGNASKIEASVAKFGNSLPDQDTAISSARCQESK